MRTSLIEIEKIENWLLTQGDIQERLVTEAKVLSSSEWKGKAHAQAQSYELIRFYGREKLRREIRTIERHLFLSNKHKPFQDIIKSIFKR